MSGLAGFVFRISFILLAPILVGVLVFVGMNEYLAKPMASGSTEKKFIVAAPGENVTFKNLCKEMQSKGVVKAWWSVYLLRKFKGKALEIKAGEYALSPGMTPREVLDIFYDQKIHKRTVKVVPGMDYRKIARRFADSGLVTEAAFIAGIMNRDMLSRAGLRADSFEGYLFPGKYSFSKGESVNRMIRSLVDAGAKIWGPAFEKAANMLGLSRHKILTLASIIQGESGNPEDQLMISSVLHNRLNNGMKLRALSTIRYLVPEARKRKVKQAELKIKSVYNTFENYDLPPGPIGNPGLSAIKAALFPAESTYLFYLAAKNGSYIFARTEKEYRDLMRVHGNPIQK